MNLKAPPGVQQVWCVPAALRPASPLADQLQPPSPAGSTASSRADSLLADGQHLYVGALMAGLACPADPAAQAMLAALADALAPYLLILCLSKVSEMATLLKLRAVDCCCLGGEEMLQDLPAEGCPPTGLPPGGPLHPGAGSSLPVPAVGDDAGADDPTAAAMVAVSQLNAAVVAALERASQLEAPGAAEAPLACVEGRGKCAAAAAAEESAGCRGTCAAAAVAAEEEKEEARGCKAVCAAADCGKAPGSKWQGGNWGGAFFHGAGGAEAEEQQQLKPAASSKPGARAAAAAAAAPQPVGPARHPLLLTFAAGQVEGRFAAHYNRGLVRMDLLFAVLYLTAAACLFALGATRGSAGSGAGGGRAALSYLFLVVALLAAPLLGVAAGGQRWYAGARETLLGMVLVGLSLLCRATALPALLAAAAPGGAGPGLAGVLSLAGVECLCLTPLMWQVSAICRGGPRPAVLRLEQRGRSLCLL